MLKKKSSIRPDPASKLTLSNITKEDVVRARDSLRLLKTKIAKAKETRDGSIYEVQRTFSRQSYDRMAQMSSRNENRALTTNQNKKSNAPLSRPNSTSSKKPETPVIQGKGSQGTQPTYLQIPIQQLKQKKPAQFPDMFQPVQLFECEMGCGRKFSSANIDAHHKICKKVFQAERKAFDSSEQRQVAEEFKMPKSKKAAEREKEKEKEQQAIDKKQKWKAQSEALRMAMMSHRGKLTDEQQKQFAEVREATSNLTKCKFCSRSFNEKAAEKHIPFCEKKAKEQSMKKR